MRARAWPCLGNSCLEGSVPFSDFLGLQVDTHGITSADQIIFIGEEGGLSECPENLEGKKKEILRHILNVMFFSAGRGVSVEGSGCALRLDSN